MISRKFSWCAGSSWFSFCSVLHGLAALVSSHSTMSGPSLLWLSLTAVLSWRAALPAAILGSSAVKHLLTSHKVNGTLETLFCWLRSWGATSTVKCRDVTSSGKQLLYLPQGMFCLRNWFLSVKLFGSATEDNFSPGFRKPPFPFGFHQWQWRIFWYYCFSLLSEEVWFEVHRSHRFRATGLGPKGTEEHLQYDSVCWWIQTVLQELQFLAEGTHAVII